MLLKLYVLGLCMFHLAYAEAAKSYDYSSPSCEVSDMKLNGTKTLVLNGSNAAKVIVTCMHNERINACLG